MLDKLKDIVPEVDENKANLIYHKQTVKKQKFSFNYKSVLRFACLLIVIIPIIVIIGLLDKGVDNMSDPSMGGSSMKPGNDAEENGTMEPEQGEPMAPGGDIIEYFGYSLDVDTGILELYFNDKNAVYYIKEYDGCAIKSVCVDGVLVEANEGVYFVNSLDNVHIQFDIEINDKILIYVSTDNEHFISYCIYAE